MFIFQFISQESSSVIVLKEESLKQSKNEILPNELLDQAVFRRKDKIQLCLKEKKIYGQISLKMSVSQSGLSDIQLIESDLNDRGAIQCIIFLLKRIKFPAFKGTPIFRVYTIKFVQKNTD